MKKLQINKLNINFSVIIFSFIILFGILVIMYPMISNYKHHKDSLKMIEEYSKKTAKATDKVYNDLIHSAERYNHNLYVNGSFNSYVRPKDLAEEYPKQLNIAGNGIMAYIKIPKINVEVPIYHGTDDDVLQKGIGHFDRSSLPIGGASTHSILSGHRGFAAAKLFSDLDQMSKGDIFYIFVLNKRLTYRVSDVSVVLPEQADRLSISEGRDKVTLVTCTPFAVNTHRLLVTGDREVDLDAIDSIDNKKISVNDTIILSGFAFGIFSLSSTFYALIFWRRKKKIEEPRIYIVIDDKNKIIEDYIDII